MKKIEWHWRGWTWQGQSRGKWLGGGGEECGAVGVNRGGKYSGWQSWKYQDAALEEWLTSAQSGTTPFFYLLWAFHMTLNLACIFDAPRNTPVYRIVWRHLHPPEVKSCRIIWCVVQREHIVENRCDLFGFKCFQRLISMQFIQNKSFWTF